MRTRAVAEVPPIEAAGRPGEINIALATRVSSKPGTVLSVDVRSKHFSSSIYIKKKTPQRFIQSRWSWPKFNSVFWFQLIASFLIHLRKYFTHLRHVQRNKSGEREELVTNGKQLHRSEPRAVDEKLAQKIEGIKSQLKIKSSSRVDSMKLYEAEFVKIAINFS